MSKKALGKGLGAIISSSGKIDDLEKAVSADKNRIVDIELKNIKPNPDQPRTHFHQEEIKELADSIKSVGLIQPIIVREEKGDFFIIAGERRFRAAKIVGLKTIKSIIPFDTHNDDQKII